jgi:hypothetical protein
MKPYKVPICKEADWATLTIHIVDEGSFILTLGIDYNNNELYLLNAHYKNN